MRRTSRKLSEETKQKISMALKGKAKSESHKQALRKSLTAYWQTIPMGNCTRVETNGITP